jgi:hypothetical protein
MKEINLTEVSLKNAVRIMMEGTEYDQFQKVAAALNIPKSTLQSALDKNTLKIRDLVPVAELLGYTVKLEKR